MKNKESNGWIKLHRKMVDKAFYKKPQYFLLWIHLLLSANHAKKEFMWNGNIILVKEGQMVTGRKELCEQTGIPESTIEDILKFLERQHQIQQQKETKYRLISIVNWVKYQNPDTKSNNRATTEQQQADTNKNDNNEKKNPFSLEIGETIKNSPETMKARHDLLEKFKPEVLR